MCVCVISQSYYVFIEHCWEQNLHLNKIGVGAPDCLVGMSDLKQPPKSLFLQFFTVNAKYYGEREGTIRSKISLLINPVKCKAADCLRSEFFVLLEFAWPITSCVGDDPSWLKELVMASVIAVHWNGELWTTSHQIEIATKCNMSCLADITFSHWIKPRVLIRAEIKHI